MNTEEKIYIAKERWKCSFEELAFLLEMDKPLVIELYYQEKSLRSPEKIAINNTIDDLDLTTRTRNLLKRMGIRTIKQLITYTERFDAFRGCGGDTLKEIHEVIRRIQSVLKLTVPDLIAAFVSEGNGGVNVEVNFANSKPNYGKPITQWRINNVHFSEVNSISGRPKGWLKTIDVDVWL